jgi:signal transduction histidine kinase
MMAGRDHLTLTVVDDGIGPGHGQTTGIGLASMRERAEELGGTFQIEHLPEGGTRLTAGLPS